VIRNGPGKINSKTFYQKRVVDCMMTLKISPDILINGEHKPVNSKIRICLNCGSNVVFRNQLSIICKDCGNVEYFSN